MRTTYEGFCCTFNYITMDDTNKPHKVRMSGLNSGVHILLNNDPNDYFHQLMPLIGCKVIHLYSKTSVSAYSMSKDSLQIPESYI